MSLTVGKRYNGYIKKYRFCDERSRKVEFLFMFSLKVKDVDKENVEFYKINPLQSLNVLKNTEEFYIINKKNNKKILYSLRVVELKEDILKAKIVSQTYFDERRKFERFNLCFNDLGFLKVYIDGKLICEKAQIEDISLIGVKLYLPKILDKIEGKILEISKIEDSFKIVLEAAKVERNSNFMLIRGRIIDSNRSVTHIITQMYIKISKEILKIKEGN